MRTPTPLKALGYIIICFGAWKLFTYKADTPESLPFPEIKSTHSLVAKHLTPEKWQEDSEYYYYYVIRARAREAREARRAFSKM